MLDSEILFLIGTVLDCKTTPCCCHLVVLFIPRDFLWFQENGEWEVISASTSSTTKTREQQSFSRIYFTFVLRRLPLYHVLNTLFPVILMASLTIFVFKLPPESGERIGMSLTVLLAYAVYLTLISDHIPQTSTSASILCKSYSVASSAINIFQNEKELLKSINK